MDRIGITPSVGLGRLISICLVVAFVFQKILSSNQICPIHQKHLHHMEYTPRFLFFINRTLFFRIACSYDGKKIDTSKFLLVVKRICVLSHRTKHMHEVAKPNARIGILEPYTQIPQIFAVNFQYGRILFIPLHFCKHV